MCSQRWPGETTPAAHHGGPVTPLLVGLTGLLHSKKLRFVAVWLVLLSFVLRSWEDKLLDFLHIIWLWVLWAAADKLRNNNLRIWSRGQMKNISQLFLVHTQTNIAQFDIILMSHKVITFVLNKSKVHLGPQLLAINSNFFLAQFWIYLRAVIPSV